MACMFWGALAECMSFRQHFYFSRIFAPSAPFLSLDQLVAMLILKGVFFQGEELISRYLHGHFYISFYFISSSKMEHTELLRLEETSGGHLVQTVKGGPPLDLD